MTQANAPEIADTLHDNPNPEAAAAQTQPPPADEPAADTPAREPSIREQIAARFKEQRAAEVAALDEPVVEDQPPAAEEPPARDEPEPGLIQPPRYKVKVRGNEFEMSREDILKTAGLSEEEASGLPMPSLIRAAQINAAAEDYLTEAKTALKGARTATPPAPATPAGDDADPEPELQTKPRGTPDPALAEVVQKIQFGDPEEAATALSQAVETLFEKKRTAELEEENRSTVQKAVKEFQATNPDMFTDRRRADLLFVSAMHEIKEDLIRLGASPEDVDDVVTNPAEAIEAFGLARAQKKAVRTPEEILGAAAQSVREVFGLTTPTASTTAAAPTPRTDARTEVKRSLTPQPRSATVPAATGQPPAQQPKSPSSIVMGMRKQRGQAV